MAFARVVLLIGGGIALAAAANIMTDADEQAGTPEASVAPPPPSPAPGTLVSGTARVLSGDLLEIGGHRVRLFGVDAPEPEQTCLMEAETVPCGTRAAEALGALIGGKPVYCTVRDGGADGVVPAVCRIGSVDLSEAMADAGWAVAVPSETDVYVDEEVGALDNHRGLWAGEFLSPAEWRKQHGK